MSDPDFADAVLHHLERLDTACLDFIDADTTNPRDLQVVTQRFRDVNARKAELLNHDLLRLDGLATSVLHSSPGEWSVRFRDDVIGEQAANVAELHCRVRRRHPSLLNLAKLLRGKGDNGQANRDELAHTPRRRRGRPSDTDHKKDKQIFDAWETGSYKNYEDLATPFRLSKSKVRQAIDRHRKRIKRAGQ